MRCPSRWRPSRAPGGRERSGGRGGAPRTWARRAWLRGHSLPHPFLAAGTRPFPPCFGPARLPPPPPLALSLPPARDCPRAPAGELAVAGRTRSERCGSPGQPSSPPRARSQLNFSEVSKGLPGSPVGDSCTGPLLRLFQPARGFMPRPGMEASVAPGARARASREESRGARHTGGSGAGVPVRGRGPGWDGGGWRGWGPRRSRGARRS